MFKLKDGLRIGTAIVLDASGNLLTTAANAALLAGQPASFYTDAANLDAGTVPLSRLPVGTSGTTIPLLDGANSWSADQAIDGDITTTGSIGIGATSPSSRLHIFANQNSGLEAMRFHNAHSGGSAHSLVRFYNDSGQAGFYFNSSARGIDAGGNGFGFYNDASGGNLQFRTKGDIYFQTGASNSERLRIGAAGSLTAGGVIAGQRFTSTVAVGTPPLTVTSTTLVENLNADLLDGQDGSYYQNAANLTGTIPAARLPASTGDVTSPAGSTVHTLATVNGNVGTFGNATTAPVVTVNAKGLVTGVTTQTITPAWSSVTGKPTTVAGAGLTDALTVTGTAANAALLNGQPGSFYTDPTNMTGTIPAARMPAQTGDISSPAGSTTTTLATVNSAPGTYGSNAAVPVVTVNAKGLVTGVDTQPLGTAATRDTGVSGTMVPLLDGANTWSTFQTMPGATMVGGSGNFIRAKGSTGSTGMGLLLRWDSGSSTFHVLSTANNDAHGTWNSSRPFSWVASNNTVNSNSSWMINPTFSSTVATLDLNGNTGNWIRFNSAGSAGPAFTTRSTGTKLVLYPQVGASNADYAIGVETQAVWMSVPTSTNQGFKFYGGTSVAAQIPAGGGLLTIGTVRAPNFVANALTGTPPMLVFSTTRVDNFNADLLDGQHGSYFRDAANMTGIVPAASMPAQSGDVSSPEGSTELTLATINATPGTVGNATTSPVLTVNGKGLVTAIGTQTITPAWGSITDKPTTLSGYGITDAASALSLGTAATRDIGTSGNSVAMTDGANTWSADQSFAGNVVVSGDLTVLGQNFTVNATNLEVADAIITVGKNNTTGALPFVGLKAERSAGGNDAYFVWDEAADEFSALLSSSESLSGATGGVIRAARLRSTAATGTAPLIIASTTLVSNLNADLLDGQQGSFYQSASNLNAGTLPAARLPAQTGDVTSPAGSAAMTLATVNSDVGTFGNATTAAAVTVNAKGLVTAVSTQTITPSWSSITDRPNTLAGFGITDAVSSTGIAVDSDKLGGQVPAFYTNASNVNAGTLLAARLPASTGDVTSPAGSSAFTLATVNSNVGTFGSNAAVPVITVNAKGLVTSVSSAGLGTAATRNIGTSGSNVPLLDGINTWSAAQTVNSSNFSVGSSSGDTNINVFATGTSNDNIVFQHDAVKRWAITSQASPNQFQVNRFDANGAFISTPLLINLSTGNVGVTHNLNVTGTVSAAGFTGPVTGSATSLATGRTIGMTGDVSWTSASFNGTGNVTGTSTLATVNSNTGSFGSNVAVPVITVNGKGLVTAVSTAALGSAAVRNVGTSGATVPLLNGTNTWTGGQNFGDASSAGLVSVDGPAATSRLIDLRTAGLRRWNIRANGDAEGGSNAGSDFQIYRYNDAGTAIAPALTINRATGWATFGGTVAATGNVVINGNNAFHAGNDGAGSGMDSDLLDGQEGVFYQNATNLNAGTIAAARMPAQTGDVSSPAGSTVTTLATVNSNVGTFGSATLIPSITVNAKGLVTGISTSVVAGAPVGGSTGQVLTKNTGADYDVGWTTPMSPIDTALTGNTTVDSLRPTAIVRGNSAYSATTTFDNSSPLSPGLKINFANQLNTSQANDNSALHVSSRAMVFGGNITQGDQGATFSLASQAGAFREFQMVTGNATTYSKRWGFGADQGAETGSNAGSNFYIQRYLDDGGWSGALTINRATGDMTIAGTVRMSNGIMVLQEKAASSIPTPIAGTQALFIDVSDKRLKRKLSNGTVVSIG